MIKPVVNGRLRNNGPKANDNFLYGIIVVCFSMPLA